MENKDKTILHLCADIGSDSKPYRDAGYNVICVGSDIGVENYTPPQDVYGIIANPPCTHFSIARTNAKTPRDLREGMRLVKECLRIIWECNYNLKEPSRTMPLKFWCIENPASGFLKWFLGKPTFSYSPHEFGGEFTKQTALWGNFNIPQRPFWINQLPANRSVSDVITPMKVRNKYERMNLRSQCDTRFAQAFYEANP